jgi:outer membrane protein TolC
LRAQRQAVVRDVKRAYYAVLQTESALEASDASLKQYQELDRVVLQRVSQEAALKSDSLEVKAKLAQEQYKALQLRHTLQSQKEQLNYLLGRDIRLQFRTEPVPAASAVEGTLKAAQDTALAQRPEIKQAEISMKQANYERRIAKSQYLPDLGMAFHYLSPFNVEHVPSNIAALGFELNWEPFDWGRRAHEVSQKRITLDQRETELREVQSKVLLDVDERFRKLQESRVLLTVAQAAQEFSREKLREVTHRYAQQAVLLRDVLQQQAAVATANHDYEQALLGFWTAQADLEQALGEE